ncbi:dihydrofolate reductase [Roseimaritima sediminicola]|uniref:dihydrofolate reductase n=1 Tax=Roseimaritima sediminicola TaxID=2662066 RepID=UPI0012983C32|nr:dihydrofolate reductase [Roseimaritima sediminicola]
MGIAAIVAATATGVIGRDGDMPWRLSSDLRRFKQLTMGCPIVMGRKTYDSIGRPLPGRETIVVTRNPSWRADGVVTASPQQALEHCRAQPESFVVGGAEIYRLMLPACETIYLTRVWSEVGGDTVLDLERFLESFRKTFVQSFPPSARDSVPTEFQIWRRK